MSQEYSYESGDINPKGDGGWNMALRKRGYPLNAIVPKFEFQDQDELFLITENHEKMGIMEQIKNNNDISQTVDSNGRHVHRIVLQLDEKGHLFRDTFKELGDKISHGNTRAVIKRATHAECTL